MIAFEKLGCDEAVERAFKKSAKALKKQGLVCELGRVISLDRGFPLVRTASCACRAELATTIKKSADSIVAVGDWVALAQPKGHEKAIIAQVLDRAVEIARVKRVGRENQVRKQVLAANADRVFICQSLTGAGVDWRLLIRQMAAVAGCGATPYFVFTKRDLVDSAAVEETIARAARIAPDVISVAIATDNADDVELVRAWCAPSTTGLLLGESGVGKSSLVNMLVGEELVDVGEVRSSDDKGRHTTVARRIIEIPGGGLLIDAPGLRTLQIIDLERSLRRAFPDIVDAALGCRFRDCTHTDEPGCVVREEIAEERLEAYRYLVESDWRR